MEKQKRGAQGEKPLAVFQRKKNIATALFGAFSAVALVGLIDYIIFSFIINLRISYVMDLEVNSILSAAPIFGFILLLIHIFLIQIGIKRLERFFHTRISIYEDGIELQEGNSFLFASWDELDSFAKVRFLKDANRNEYETLFGLKLTEAIRPEKYGFWENLVAEPSQNFLRLSWDFLWIPYIGLADEAKIDRENLRNTELGKILLRYAPHLFSTEEKLKNPLEDGFEDSYTSYELKAKKQKGLE